MKSIIVDDEPNSRSTLNRLIELHCPNVEVAALCEDLASARQAMLEKQPDLIFLDIQLPGNSGFELIENIKDRNFAVIFTTAYEQHAIQAFNCGAQDYLLKPFHSERLKEAIVKAEGFLSRSTAWKTEAAMSGQLNRVSKVALPVAFGFTLVEPHEIVRFKGNGSYSEVFLSNGQRLLLTQNLKRIEALINGKGFYRIHNSHIVNIQYVRHFTTQDGGFVELENGSSLEVSRRRLSGFKNALGM